MLLGNVSGRDKGGWWTEVQVVMVEVEYQWFGRGGVVWREGGLVNVVFD